MNKDAPPDPEDLEWPPIEAAPSGPLGKPVKPLHRVHGETIAPDRMERVAKHIGGGVYDLPD